MYRKYNSHFIYSIQHGCDRAGAPQYSVWDAPCCGTSVWQRNGSNAKTLNCSSRSQVKLLHHKAW